MKIYDGVFTLDRVARFDNHVWSFVRYTDIDNNDVRVPIEVIVRLYEFAKHRTEECGKNWDEEVTRLFEVN